jgi:hypothetical protein
MQRYAIDAQRNPLVRLLAEEIVTGLAPKDFLSEILAVYNFTCSHLRYANDPRTIELIKRPERIIKEIAAGKTPSVDCDDIATFMAALLLSLGRHVRIVTVAFRKMVYKGNVQYSHVFLQAQEPRSMKWITLDPVAAEDTDKMLSEVRVIKYWPVAA